MGRCRKGKAHDPRAQQTKCQPSQPGLWRNFGRGKDGNTKQRAAALGGHPWEVWAWGRPERGLCLRQACTLNRQLGPTLRVELVGHVLAQHPGVAAILNPGGAIPQPHPRHCLVQNLIQPPQRLLQAPGTTAGRTAPARERRGRQVARAASPLCLGRLLGPTERSPSGRGRKGSPEGTAPSAHLYLHHVPQHRRHVSARHRRRPRPRLKLAGGLLAAAVELLQALPRAARDAHVAQQGLLQRGDDLRKGAAQALDNASAAGRQAARARGEGRGR